MGEFVSVPHHNGIPGDSLACGILSRGIQLFVGVRETANLEGNERKGRRGRRPRRLPIKVSFIRLRCLLFKAYISGSRKGVEGEFYKEQRSGHLLTWGAKSGTRQRALCILSPEHRSSLTALGRQAGLRLNSCLWMAWKSGRDREEGVSTGSLAQGHLVC